MSNNNPKNGNSAENLLKMARNIRKIDDTDRKAKAVNWFFSQLVTADNPGLEALLRDTVPTILGINKGQYDSLIKEIKQSEVNEGENEENSPRYIMEEDCYFEIDTKTSKKVQLTDFVVSIERELVYESNSKDIRKLEVSGKTKNGNKLPRLLIDAKEFKQLDWVTTGWGIDPIISAGYQVKEKVREAIQHFNKGVPKEKIFSSLGWKTFEGDKGFITGAGGLGFSKEVNVDLPSQLSGYKLPLEPENEVEAVSLILELTSLGPPWLILSLLGIIFLAPLRPFLPTNFVVWIYGVTCAMKSTISALFLSFFGEFSYETLPGNWISTPNSLGKLMSLAADVPFVIDDFTPKSEYRSRSALEKAAAQIIRQIGNRDDRYRMNRDTSLRETNIPQALVLSTGELLPPGQSETARFLALEMKPGDIDIDLLDYFQRNADKFPHAMAGYLLYVKDNWNRFEKELPERHRKLRQNLQKSGLHLRLPNAIAAINLAFECFLDYCMEIKAISKEKRQNLSFNGSMVFEHLGTSQARLIEKENPVYRFLGIFFELLDQGTIRLEPIGDSTDPIFNELVFDDEGELAGYYDDRFLYLLPNVAYNIIARFCNREGHPFPVDNHTLRRSLLQEDFLKDGDGDHLTNQKTINGRRSRYVTLIRGAIRNFFEE